MYNIISYEEATKLKNPLFIDIRSEKEFEESTIPNSINLPILNNSERKIVGKLYDNVSIDFAKKKGVEFGSQKLSKYYNFISDKSKENSVIIFCARGGYRSTILFNFLRSLNIKIYKLDKGYKGYRRYILENLENISTKFDYVNLNGYTGSGKTKILKYLEDLGAQVLNLEELANHRGSNFGQIGLGKQPSQKMFESILYEKLNSFTKNTVFVESESTKIGKINVPKYLYSAYTNSKHQVFIDSGLDDRINRIKAEYLKIENEDNFLEIMNSLKGVEKHIGKENSLNLKKNLENKNYDFVIKFLIERYYDINYAVKRKNFEFVLKNSDSKLSAQKLYERYVI